MANNRHRLIARIKAKDEKRMLKAMTPIQRFMYGVNQTASSMRDAAITLVSIFQQGVNNDK